MVEYSYRKGDDTFVIDEEDMPVEHSIDFGGLVLDTAGGRIVGVEIYAGADRVMTDEVGSGDVRVRSGAEIEEHTIRYHLLRFVRWLERKLVDL